MQPRRRTPVFATLTFALSLGAAGCSSMSNGARTGTNDAATGGDSGAAASAEGGPQDGAFGMDATEAATASCPSLDAVCPGDGGDADAGCVNCFTYHCVNNWPAAHQFCLYDMTIYPVPDCGGFDLILDVNGDVSYVYYYDQHTGALAGIGFYGFQGQLSCIAGTVVPLAMMQCNFPTATTQSACFPADAGGD